MTHALRGTPLTYGGPAPSSDETSPWIVQTEASGMLPGTVTMTTTGGNRTSRTAPPNGLIIWWPL